MKCGWILAAVALVAACDGGDTAVVEARSAGGGGHALHVDCGATADGNGTRAAPWNSLASASGARLGGGTQLLLKRGSVCVGTLKPRGSGTPARPIVIGAYGEGPAPRIDGAAGVAAVWLEDMSHVIVEDLELTNRGDATALHRGIYVTAAAGPVAGIVLRRLFIHHVESDVSFANGKLGGAVIVDQTGGAPARFDDVLVEELRIEDVGRSGIYIRGRPATARPRATEPWPEAPTGVIVRHNTLTRLQGDGIVAHGTRGAVLEHNVVSEGNLAGRSFADPVNRNCAAGIWTWNANATLIQYNEVFGMRFGQSETDGCDGTAFDVDYHQDGGIIQFNYSHDNGGGFILLCSDERPRAADVRYNLSVNDAHTFGAVPCEAPSSIGGFDGVRIYNNTFVAANPNTTAEGIPLPTLYNAGTFLFQNNIVYATQPTVVPLQCGNQCSHNLFFNIAPSGTHAVIGDPLFEDAGAQSPAGYRLRTGSPAIGAGAPVEANGGADYFGSAVPPSEPPTIGFHEAR